MAKLQSTEIVGVANRPATICPYSACFWFDTTNLLPMVSYNSFTGTTSVTWYSGGALITARSNLGVGGTQNLGLANGGIESAFNICPSTEEYNGTSWSTGGNLLTARYRLAGGGTQNEGLAVGGYTNVLFQILKNTMEQFGQQGVI